MPWTTPTDPVALTVITVAWAQSNVIGPLTWLRRMTGQADPPGAGYAAFSDNTTATTWQRIPAAAYSTGTIPDAAMVNQKANKIPPVYTHFDTGIQADGSGFFDVSVASGAPDGGGGSWHVIQTRHNNYGVDYRLQIATNIAAGDDIYFRKLDASGPSAWFKFFHTGDFSAINQVPSGLIAAFRTAAAFAAGWTRFTDGDGRVLIGGGAGTTDTAFTENTASGAAWAHAHGIGTLAGSSAGIDAAGGGFLAATAGGSTSAAPAGHVHPAPAITVTGAPASVAWAIPARIVVHAQKT